MEKLTIESWLPLFNGFYDTIFSIDNDLYQLEKEIDSLSNLDKYQANKYFLDTFNNSKDNEFREKIFNLCTSDYLLILKQFNKDRKKAINSFDNETYNNDFGLNACETVENYLTNLNLIDKIDFQTTISPKYYNYRNDSINCKYTLTNENIQNIRNYLELHKNKFQTYLENNYTSYDGFLSYYDANLETWFENLEKDHEFGSIMNFILENENINSESLFYDMEINLHEYIDESNENDLLEYVTNAINNYENFLYENDIEL